MSSNNLAVYIAISGFVFQIFMFFFKDYKEDKKQNNLILYNQYRARYFKICIPYIKLLLENNISGYKAVLNMPPELKNKFPIILSDNFEILTPNLTNHYSKLFNTVVNNKNSKNNDFATCFKATTKELLFEAQLLSTKIKLEDISKEVYFQFHTIIYPFQ